MSHFLTSILTRHAGTVEKVLPRLPGSFEPVSSFPNTGLSEFPVATEKQAPEISTLNKSGIQHEGPVVMDKPGTFLQGEIEQSSPQIQKDLLPPINLNPEPPLFKASNEPQSGVFQPDYQESEAFKPANNPEPGPGLEGHKTQTNRIISTETKWVSRLQEFEPVTIQPSIEADGKELKENAPIIPTDYRRAIVEPKGALGEPPGRMNAYNIPGKQGIADLRAEPKAEPVIKVSIGQIHVRAVNPPPSVTAKKPQQAHKPVLTLEDYLKGRG